MARAKGRLIDLNAPAPKGKKPGKVTNRLFPKFLVWLITAIVLAGLVAKLLHVINHHW